eukprot:1160131-Pelagomonas_calceolata.AAC.4
MHTPPCPVTPYKPHSVVLPAIQENRNGKLEAPQYWRLMYSDSDMQGVRKLGLTATRPIVGPSEPSNSPHLARIGWSLAALY